MKKSSLLCQLSAIKRQVHLPGPSAVWHLMWLRKRRAWAGGRPHAWPPRHPALWPGRSHLPSPSFSFLVRSLAGLLWRSHERCKYWCHARMEVIVFMIRLSSGLLSLPYIWLDVAIFSCFVLLRPSQVGYIQFLTFQRVKNLVSLIQNESCMPDIVPR